MSSNKGLESANRDGQSDQQKIRSERRSGVCYLYCPTELARFSGRNEASLVEGFVRQESALCFGNIAASSSSKFSSHHFSPIDIGVVIVAVSNGIRAEACG